MASKRTRSAPKNPQPEDASSNVTDYMGPYKSKRQKRGDELANTTRVNGLARATRSSGVARNPPVEPQQQTAPTRRGVGEQRANADEEDDDDASVHVDHNQISLAINEARRGRQRTVNALRATENQLRALHAKAAVQDKGRGDDGDADEQHARTTVANPESKATPRRRGRPPKPNRNGMPRQHSPAKTFEKDSAVRSAQEVSHTPVRELRSRRGATARNAPAEGQPIPQQQQVAQERQRNQEKLVAPVQNDAVGAEISGSATSGSEEDDSEGEGPNAADDSAFIEAPRPDEESVQVRITISRFGGIDKALGHSAWTGLGNRAENFEPKCKSSLGRALMKCTTELEDLFKDAIEARSGEEDAEAAYQMTTDYLRDHSDDVEKHVAGITEMVGRICRDKLAPCVDLAAREVKARKTLLRDMSERLIPKFVLVVKKACHLGPSETTASSLHLILDCFTLQFLLRSVAWTKRLVETLNRGLEHWPIDDEFMEEESDLDVDKIKLRNGKRESRDFVQRRISALSVATEQAAKAMDDQAKQATERRHQEQLRRKNLIRQRALWVAEQQRMAREKEQSAQRWDAFCMSTQALRFAPDPMQQKWIQAEEARREYEASQASVFRTTRQTRAHDPNRKGKDCAQDDWLDHDPFATDEEDEADVIDEDDEDGNPFKSSPIHAAGGKDSIARSGHVVQASQASKAWDGLDWTEEEERILLESIRYFRNYDPASMAGRLNRSVTDVSRKATLFKDTYKKIYTERGAGIPVWAI